MQVQINHTMLELVAGDITQMNTMAIVNPSVEGLTHGGGLAAQVANAGGPVIQQESNEWIRKHGLVPAGSVAITSGGNLKARYVIHAVGPIYDGTPRSATLLASAVRTALQMADERGLRSIAVPAISTGIFGYPKDEAAHVILGTVIAYLRGTTKLYRVVICLADQPMLDIFTAELAAQLSQERDE